MRDEIDARLWVDHHESLPHGVERVVALFRAGVIRFAGWDGSTHHLIALFLAFAVTALAFNTTTA